MPFSNRHIIIGKLESALGQELPGEKAQYLMAPSIREEYDTCDKSQAVKSSVLILLYEKDNEVYTVFIKRSLTMNKHSGQISLPGGKHDISDINMEYTALRETHEELGVSPREITLVGGLSPLYIPVSNFMVYPYVGFTQETPVFEPSVNEVSEVIEVSLNSLFAPSSMKSDWVKFNNEKYSRPYYDALGHKVWGATAMIISEFNQIIC